MTESKKDNKEDKTRIQSKVKIRARDKRDKTVAKIKAINKSNEEKPNPITKKNLDRIKETESNQNTEKSQEDIRMTEATDDQDSTKNI